MAHIPAIIVIVLTWSVSATAAALRFHVRQLPSDYAILASLFFQTILLGTGVTMFVTPALLLRAKLFYAGIMFYYCTVWSTKISVNLLHLHLTSRSTLAKASLIYVVATGVIVVAIQTFGCWPIERRFLPGNCQVQGLLFWICYAFNVSTDLILCILPYSVLVAISERRLRVAVCAVFALAGVMVVSTTAGSVMMHLNVQGGDSAKIVMFCQVETMLGVVISTVPGMSRAFTRKYVYRDVAGPSGMELPTIVMEEGEETPVGSGDGFDAGKMDDAGEVVRWTSRELLSAESH